MVFLLIHSHVSGIVLPAISPEKSPPVLQDPSGQLITPLRLVVIPVISSMLYFEVGDIRTDVIPAFPAVVAGDPDGIAYSIVNLQIDAFSVLGFHPEDLHSGCSQILCQKVSYVR